MEPVHAKQFKKALDAYLGRHGFSKANGYYQRVGNGVICVIDLQRSAYSGGYYLNVGFFVSELRPSLESLRDADADLTIRFFCEGAQGRTDVFVPESFSDEAQLLRVLDDNFRDHVESALDIEGLKAFITRPPALLKLVGPRARQFLGLA